MVKVYKSKNGKLVVYIPFDVVSALKLKEDDEVDFFRINEKSFIMAKKSDIMGMILGGSTAQTVATVQPQRPQEAPRAQNQPSQEELAVLKKIDTIRYENRTQENVYKILSDADKKVLQALMAKGMVSKYRGKSGKELYSIPKNIYDSFLMRKKPQQPRAEDYGLAQQAPKYKAQQDESVEELEKNGFIVLQTEAEASRVSLLLENSIRHGQVLGTRSFSKNREFYIILRSYFDRYAQPVLRKLREKDWKVTDLCRELGISEDGARSILYILAESGDVMERKRDLFTIA